MNNLTFDPILPLWLLGILLTLGAAVVFWSYFRSGLLREQPVTGWILAFVKLTALLAVGAMMAKPMLSVEEQRKEQAPLLVLVDYSESMNIRDEQRNRTRFETARELVGHVWSDDLAERFDVKLFEFSSFLRQVNRDVLLSRQKAAGAATDIGSAIQQAARSQAGHPPAALVLLSDGVHNTGTHPAETLGLLQGQNIPLFSVGLGGDQIYRDVELNEAIFPDLVFENEKVTIGVDLTAYGFEGHNATVRLLRTGITETGQHLEAAEIRVEELERKEVELFGEGFRQRVEFDYQPERIGDHHLLLESLPLEGESVRANNQIRAILSVVKQQITVLILEGSPRWETTMLTRSLRRDPRFQIDTLYLLEPTERLFYPLGPGFPQRWGDDFPRRFYPLAPPFDTYDCIIVGNIAPALFADGSLEQLAEQVSQEGKALLILPGQQGFADAGWWQTPINHLIPVTPDVSSGVRSGKVELQLTPEGRLHPLTNFTGQPALSSTLWESMPEGFEYYPTGRLRPGAVSLVVNKAVEGEPPILTFQRVGKGRVIALLFDQTWLWALSPETLLRQNRVHSRFWRGAVRYAVTGASDFGEEGIRVQVDKNQVSRGETLEAQVRVFQQMEEMQAKVHLEIMTPDGLSRDIAATPDVSAGEQRLATRHYTARIRADQVGEYSLTAKLIRDGVVVDESTTVFVSELTAFEHRDAGLNRQLLQSLAERTGGRYYDSGEAVKLPEDLPESERMVKEVRKTELWNSLALFLLLAVALKSEWIARKWMDLN